MPLQSTEFMLVATVPGEVVWPAAAAVGSAMVAMAKAIEVLRNVLPRLPKDHITDAGFRDGKSFGQFTSREYPIETSNFNGVTPRQFLPSPILDCLVRGISLRISKPKVLRVNASRVITGVTDVLVSKRHHSIILVNCPRPSMRVGCLPASPVDPVSVSSPAASPLRAPIYVLGKMRKQGEWICAIGNLRTNQPAPKRITKLPLAHVMSLAKLGAKNPPAASVNRTFAHKHLPFRFFSLMVEGKGVACNAFAA